MTDRKEFYSVTELAEYLSVHPETIRRLIKRKELPAYVIGRVKRIRHSDVEAYLERNRDAGGSDVDDND